MDKSDFLSIYRPLLTIHFYDDAFLKDDDIDIVEQKVPFREMMDFYALRTVKNGIPDRRGIEERINDLKSKLITLEESRRNPMKWGLDHQHRAMPPLENIRPIPIATDLSRRRTLILDSNHLLANLNCTSTTPIPLVQMVGRNLEKVVPDFKILNRQ